jgi:leucyl aminopeptidase
MTNAVLTDVPRASIPLIALPVAALKDWLKKQPKATVAWLEASGFEAKPGRFALVPNAKGGLAFVVTLLSEPASLWDLAALPTALPKAVYRLELFDGVPADRRPRLALGWMLGAERAVTYKKGPRKTVAQLAVGKTIDLTRVGRMARSLLWVRELITTPAADMTPDALAAAVRAVGDKYGASVREIAGDDLLAEGFCGIHAVGRASAYAPRLLDVMWGDPRHPSVVLVGKGVCFDTGGLSLKPGRAMALMKKDMAGAAIALGVARFVMEAGLPLNLRLLLPIVENAIGGNALRVSDVLRMKGGISVEVANTDAEGRLVTAEALAEAVAGKPDLVVDFTTLGPGRALFGDAMAALFCNDDALAARVQALGVLAEDPLWRMPLAAAYEGLLDSPMADMTNAPEAPYAQAITAALFLQRFVGKKTPWIHLDFMAWNIAARPGRPVGGEATALRAVVRLLEGMASSAT